MRHRHRPVPEQDLSSIMQLATCLLNDRLARAALQPSAGDGPRTGMDARRAGAGRLRITAGGAAAAVLPAGSALAWLIERHSGAALLFAVAVITVGAAILGTIAAMYEAWQETRRTEIECRSADTIAAALARYIDNTYRPP